MTALVLDVKGTSSEVVYPSEHAPQVREWKGFVRPDFDFVGTFVEAAHDAGLEIYGSFNTFAEGNGVFRRGLIYDGHPEWQAVNYVPGRGLVPQLEIPEKKVQYVITNEAGASVYSASKLATEEFPNFDVGQRSATSMARRLQDPLAELVKIDPKSIGVGQYQHDMNQKKLSEALGGVVEDCVNKVGVDLNTASVSLLEYISGISKVIAKNIVAYREENGKFASRSQLLKVAKLGPKAYEQCAGFMRITGGKNPLDATSVHPESYEAATAILKKTGFTPEDITSGNIKGLSLIISDYKKLSDELGVGEFTLKDIVKELEKPGRDPRDEMPKPILKSDVLSMEDLKPGMLLTGTVRNVIDFGAFVDIGVHQDGLVHVSQMSDKKFVKHPMEIVSVGDIVRVKVLNVDIAKKRIQLSMII